MTLIEILLVPVAVVGVYAAVALIVWLVEYRGL